MTARPVLELSSAEQLSDWLGVPITARLVESLQAARDTISARLRPDVAAGSIPDAVHRAATMMAASIHERRESVYGVEAFSVGLGADGAGGVGWMTTDPTIRMLLRPWVQPPLGVAPVPAGGTAGQP